LNRPLQLSRVHFPVTTLGPGQRLGIWFQGCSIRCSGCISADTWGPGRTVVDVATLLEQVAPWLAQADGITISGGEPFDQFDALLQMLVGLRQRTAADILVYSGHPLETLQPMLDQARDLIDAVISDPYLEHAALAGLARTSTPADKALDLMFDATGTVWMAGIPRRGDLLRLRELLRAQGHQVQTSAHTSSRRPAE
jgi:anaerobic ribonucleoside-triphosphate reductase activating protein